jgi:hypothetical protein
MFANNTMSLSVSAALLIAGSAVAGFDPSLTQVTLTTSMASGTGLYSTYDGYTLSLDMSFATDASATVFTLNNWTFRVLNLDGAEVFQETGSDTQPGFDPGLAKIALTNAGFLGGSLTPAPTELQFSYQFDASNPGLLRSALEESAKAGTGLLTVGTYDEIQDQAGSLEGAYTFVPGPSALALLALGAVLTRRRAA